MISTDTITATIFSLIVCFAIPIGSLIWLLRRRQGLLRPWVIGVIAFTVSQLVLRLPLIQLVLPRQDWYIRLSLDPVGHGLFLAFTAGLFEEVARYICFRNPLRNNRRWIDGIAFGFGHGGIEALAVTGITLVNMLVVFMAINNGTLNSLMPGVDPAAVNAIRQHALSTTPLAMILGGIERILAVALHIGMTMIVLTGFRLKHPLAYLAAAIGVHTLIDAVVAIVPRVMKVDVLALELIIAVFAALLAYYTLRVRRLYGDDTPAKGGEPHARR